MEYTLKELEEWNVKIEKKAKEFGLDYYPQEFEIIGFNEMLAYEAYVGMPSKYPHWSYGKSYEKNAFHHESLCRETPGKQISGGHSGNVQPGGLSGNGAYDRRPR